MNLNDMTVTDLLQKGKERVAAGWCRYAFIKRTETGYVYCARGAVGAIDAPMHHLVMAAEKALEATMECPRHTVAEFEIAFNGVISVPQDISAGWRVASHNNECLGNQTDALDWFDRAIRYAKDAEAHCS